MPPVGHRARGDYNGDGTSDVAIYRSSSGLWAVRSVTRVYFGGGDDDPVPRDYNGDGTTDFRRLPAVFRGFWSVRGVTGRISAARMNSSVPGDYNGGGKSDTMLYGPRGGLWSVFTLKMI